MFQRKMFYVIGALLLISIAASVWVSVQYVQAQSVNGNEPPPSRPIYEPLYEQPLAPEAAAPEQQDFRNTQITNHAFAATMRAVYADTSGNGWGIFYQDLDGPKFRITPNDRFAYLYPRLFPDINQILFVSDLDVTLDLYRMPIGGYEDDMVRLTFGPGDSIHPCISKDGTRIVYEYVENDQADVYMMNANGSNRVRLTSDPDYDGMPCFSPDGSKIVFVSRRSGGYRIYTMGLDASNLQQLNNQPYSASPIWSPSGEWIGYSADGNGDGFLEVWKMKPDGTAQEMLKNEGYMNNDFYPYSWTPDEDYLFLTKYHWWFSGERWLLDRIGIDRIGLRNSYYYDHPYLQTQGYSAHPDWRTDDQSGPVVTLQQPPMISPYQINLNWNSFDAGINILLVHQVQYKQTDENNWHNLTDWSSELQAQFQGIGGKTYQVRVLGKDKFYNISESNWVTFQIEDYPPITHINPLPEFSKQRLMLSWLATDPGKSGVAGYDVRYRVHDSGAWQMLHTNITDTLIFFDGTPGEQYDFQVRARDYAQNEETWSDRATVQTTIFAWDLQGAAYDHTGTPLELTTFEIDTQTLAKRTDWTDGSL